MVIGLLALLKVLVLAIRFAWAEVERNQSQATPPPRPPSPSSRPAVSPAGRSLVEEVSAEPIPPAQFVGQGYTAKMRQEAHCLVCRGLLEKDVVSCEKCATLTHQDCWNYNRGCATYGCRRAA